MTKSKQLQKRTLYITNILFLWLYAVTAIPVSGQVFTRITEGSIGTDIGNTFGASWIDFDGDGDQDLYVSNAASLFPNLFYVNEGDGTFTRITEGAIVDDPGIAAVGSCWADYDNDGDLDVFNAGAPNSFLYRNDGKGTFTKITTGDIGDSSDRRGWSCAWGDYNEDGHVDLFVAHPAGFLGTPAISNSFFKNNGDGTFSAVTDTPITVGLAPYTVGNWIDYDEDGDIDLLIGSGPAVGTVDADFLYRNMLSETGSATFERITELPLNDDRDGQTWNFIDYDNDGDRDGFVTNYWGGFANGMPNELFQNEGGVLTEVTTGPLVTDEGFSLANVWEDFDNDGDMDLFITSEFGTENVYYRNEGAPNYSFTRTDLFAGTTLSNYGATAGDFDLDGDLDLFFPSGGGGGNHLYRNDTPQTNSWVNIKTVGTISNATGVAAKLRVRTDIDGKATWQQREVSTQNTFNGHSSLNVHFGLGDASKISKVEVTWPSGLVETENNVNVNTFYVAIEGDGLEPLSAFLLNTLKDRVQALRMDEVISDGQATPLKRLLNQAISEIEDDENGAAAALITSYLEEVDALVSGSILSEVDGKDVTDPAETALHLVGGPGSVAAATFDAFLPVLKADFPKEFKLSQNHPNPFNPSTSIAFSLPEESHVQLSIYDMQGRQVASLVDGARGAGRHEVRWEARGLASGLYMYRIEAGSFTETKMLHLLK